ncbi:hypothetical protein [Rhizobium leguminosarum]|nr:hypothetical protein [Rhizobium leguminosarum]
MREKLHVIKALNALKSAGGFEHIVRIPFLGIEMAEKLVALGYVD